MSERIAVLILPPIAAGWTLLLVSRSRLQLAPPSRFILCVFGCSIEYAVLDVAIDGFARGIQIATVNEFFAWAIPLFSSGGCIGGIVGVMIAWPLLFLRCESRRL